jgi:serine protease Do
MNLFKHRAVQLAALLALTAASACERAGVGDAHAQTSTATLSRAQAETASAVAPDTAAAYALSAAFRTASDRALPAVIYVRVERQAQVQSRGRAPVAPGIPEEFQRFFEFGDPEQGELPPQGASGSGFIIDAEGHAVTNNHVIAEAERITVRLVDGREFDATLVGTDPNTDIALIKINADGAKLPVIPGFGEAERMRVGDWVLALGNPLGYDFTVTAGIVSAKGRQLALGNANALESYIQTDAAINVGNSGGPLVDLSGRVVGVNTAIGGASRWVGYGFAVPSELVQRVLADIREYGHVRRPKLGVRVQPVTALDAEVFGLDRVTGAKVFSVDQGTPAQRAGVRAGDVIVTLDGKEIPTSNALTTSLAQHHPGERVTLGIVRDKRRTELAVTLGEFEQATASAERRDGAGRGAREERLGFSVQPLTPQLASQFELTETSGVVVVDVRNFSPAAAAAVRPGLLIRSINGDEVSTPQDVARIAGDISAGDAVSIRGVYAGIGEVVINFRAR